MKKSSKLFISGIVVLMLLGVTTFAGSTKTAWFNAYGNSYGAGSFYQKSYYDGLEITISKIAKLGETTDKYTYAKVRAAADPSVTWLYSGRDIATQESKQYAICRCQKGITYEFLLTDGKGNIGMTSAVATGYHGNSSLLDASVYVTERIY